MATIASLTVVTRAKTAQFDRAMRTSGKRVHGLRKDLRSLAAGVGLYFGGRALIGFATKAIREFAAFEKQMALVHTMLDKGASHLLPKYTKEVERLSIAYGQATDAMGKGLYDILSAGVGTADALHVLEVATRAAIAGASDTATAVKTIVALLNAYQLSASDAGRVSDILFGTVKRGVITFEELAANIGKSAPLARAAGMRMSDMGAVLATLTKQGLSAEEATTRLNAILKILPDAGRDFVRSMEEFRGMDLAGILARVGNIRAAAGIAALAGDVDGLTKNMQELRSVTGEAEEAFEKMADTADMRLRKLEQRTKAMQRAIGQWLYTLPGALAETFERVFSKEFWGKEAWLTVIEGELRALPAIGSGLGKKAHSPSAQQKSFEDALNRAGSEEGRKAYFTLMDRGLSAFPRGAMGLGGKRSTLPAPPVPQPDPLKALQETEKRAKAAADLTERLKGLTHEVRIIEIRGIEDVYTRQVALLDEVYNEKIRLAKRANTNITADEIALMQKARNAELTLASKAEAARRQAEALRQRQEEQREIERMIESRIKQYQDAISDLMSQDRTGDFRRVRTSMMDVRGLRADPAARWRQEMIRLTKEEITLLRKQLEKSGVPS